MDANNPGCDPATHPISLQESVNLRDRFRRLQKDYVELENLLQDKLLDQAARISELEQKLATLTARIERLDQRTLG